MSQSRIEAILQAIIDGTDVSQLPSPQSRNEALLLQILDKINHMGGGGTLPIHICSSGEYDPVTGVPTVSSPEPETFYLVPSSEAETNNLFVEWVYVENAWEKFFEVKAEIQQSDWNQTDTTAQDYIKNKPDVPDVGKFSITIPILGWAQVTSELYSVTINVPGVKATDSGGVFGLVQTDNENTNIRLRNAFGKITRVSAANNAIVVYALAVPTIAIPTQLEVIR